MLEQYFPETQELREKLEKVIQETHRIRDFFDLEPTPKIEVWLYMGPSRHLGFANYRNPTRIHLNVLNAITHDPELIVYFGESIKLWDQWVEEVSDCRTVTNAIEYLHMLHHPEYFKDIRHIIDKNEFNLDHFAKLIGNVAVQPKRIAYEGVVRHEIDHLTPKIVQANKKLVFLQQQVDELHTQVRSHWTQERSDLFSANLDEYLDQYVNVSPFTEASAYFAEHVLPEHRPERADELVSSAHAFLKINYDGKFLDNVVKGLQLKNLVAKTDQIDYDVKRLVSAYNTAKDAAVDFYANYFKQKLIEKGR